MRIFCGLVDKKERKCILAGCEKKHVAKGYCWKHYERNRKFGDPLTTKTAEDGEPLAFLCRVKVLGNFDGCVIWPFGRQGDGYGCLRFDGKMQQAHRVSLYLSEGPAPDGKPNACHSPSICHNRLCVNPRHLRWASKSENEMDKVSDNTSMRKLSDADVIAIRGMVAEGITNVSIADKFGVTPQYISRIKSGKACLLYTSPSPRDQRGSRMPSSA